MGQMELAQYASLFIMDNGTTVTLRQRSFHSHQTQNIPIQQGNRIVDVCLSVQHSGERNEKYRNIYVCNSSLFY